MNTLNKLDEYQTDLRAEVCSRRVEHRPGTALPCGPLGEGCGIERHLTALIELCRTTDSALIDPCIENFMTRFVLTASTMTNLRAHARSIM